MVLHYGLLIEVRGTSYQFDKHWNYGKLIHSVIVACRLLAHALKFGLTVPRNPGKESLLSRKGLQVLKSNNTAFYKVDATHVQVSTHSSARHGGCHLSPMRPMATPAACSPTRPRLRRSIPRSAVLHATLACLVDGTSKFK